MSKKVVLEGYLICEPYLGDAYYIVDKKELAEKYKEIWRKLLRREYSREDAEERYGILESATRLDEFLKEGGKVRITIEYLEDRNEEMIEIDEKRGAITIKLKEPKKEISSIIVKGMVIFDFERRELLWVDIIPDSRSDFEKVRKRLKEADK